MTRLHNQRPPTLPSDKVDMNLLRSVLEPVEDANHHFSVIDREELARQVREYLKDNPSVGMQISVPLPPVKLPTGRER